MELSEIQKKNNEIFEGFFRKVFGDSFEVSCDWGFPNLELQIAQETEERKTVWQFSIHVTTGTYKMRTMGAKKENESWVPDFTMVDSSTINYIVKSSIDISNKIFGLDAAEKIDSEETKMVE